MVYEFGNTIFTLIIVYRKTMSRLPLWIENPPQMLWFLFRILILFPRTGSSPLSVNVRVFVNPLSKIEPSKCHDIPSPSPPFSSKNPEDALCSGVNENSVIPLVDRIDLLGFYYSQNL